MPLPSAKNLCVQIGGMANDLRPDRICRLLLIMPSLETPPPPHALHTRTHLQ